MNMKNLRIYSMSYDERYKKIYMIDCKRRTSQCIEEHLITKLCRAGASINSVSLETTAAFNFSTINVQLNVQAAHRHWDCPCQISIAE